MRDGDVVKVRIDGCAFKRVGDKGTPMCELDGTTESDEKLTIAIWLTEKAAGIARAQFKKIGFEIDKEDLDKFGEWLGRSERFVEVTVESYERQGALLYRGVIDTGGNSLKRDDLKAIGGWMRAAKKKGENDAPAPPVKNPLGPPIAGVDDGIPFALLLALAGLAATMA